MKAVTWFFLLATVVAANADEIRIDIGANPPLPAKNLLAGRVNNIDFEEGLKYWRQKGGANGVRETEGANASGKAVLFTGCNQMIYQQIPAGIFTKGETYIASCRVKPVTKLPFKPYNDGGPGFFVSFYPKDWSKSGSISGRDPGGKGEVGEWKKISGKPFTVPEWAVNCQVLVGIHYYEKEEGREAAVDDLCVTPAFTRLRVDVAAPVAIRQVKVVDDSGRTVFDSDVLSGGAKEFHRELKVETVHAYTVMAVTSDGDVRSVTYPEKTTAEAVRTR